MQKSIKPSSNHASFYLLFSVLLPLLRHLDFLVLWFDAVYDGKPGMYLKMDL